MTKQEKKERPTGLDLLREPFPENQISKLPKPTRRQTDEVKKDFKKGIRCELCGAWHHPDVIHLDYVGHAALTDRLLDCDPNWNWEPTAFQENGSPVRDQIGGMWIRLTVCDVTRLGYGHAEGKQGGDATKEVIGDALRNAAMRFGAALDLWHKGELHPDQEEGDEEKPPKNSAGEAIKDAWRDSVIDSLPANSTAEQRANAFADAICAEAKSKNGERALNNSWARHKEMIESFGERYPKLYERVADVYESRAMEIAPVKAAE